MLRPQTIPAGSIRGSLGSSYFRPQATLLETPAGRSYLFFSSLTVGASAAYGATDLLELGISAPRILCFSSSEPSGCDSTHRLNGAGIFLVYGWARTPSFQLRSYVSLEVARSDPATLGMDLDLRAKLLFGRAVALELAIEPGNLLGHDGAIDQHLQLNFTTDLNVQVTRHLLVFGDLDPYGPVSHLDQPALEGVLGASWTFESRFQVGMNAGVYNLLASRSWQTSVPGSFCSLSASFFL